MWLKQPSLQRVSLVGLACSCLGLLFDEAFFFLLAAGPICDLLPTLVRMMGNNGAPSLTGPQPLKI